MMVMGWAVWRRIDRGIVVRLRQNADKTAEKAAAEVKDKAAAVAKDAEALARRPRR